MGKLVFKAILNLFLNMIDLVMFFYNFTLNDKVIDKNISNKRKGILFL